LQRDGWAMSNKEYQGATLFEKKLPKSWLLRKLAFAEIGAPPGRGCYWDAHELRPNHGHGPRIPRMGMGGLRGWSSGLGV